MQRVLETADTLGRCAEARNAAQSAIIQVGFVFSLLKSKALTLMEWLVWFRQNP